MSLTDDNEQKEKDIEHYPAPGSIRYIAFIQKNGKRLALSYSLLPTIAFEPGEEHNIIVMTFPEHTITMTGHNLKKLCEALENEKIRSIRTFEERYLSVPNNENDIMVLEVEIAGRL